MGTWNDGGCSGGGAVVVGDRRLSNVLYLDLCKIRGSLTGDYLCGTCFILFIIIFLSFFLNIFIFISIKKCGVVYDELESVEVPVNILIDKNVTH